MPGKRSAVPIKEKPPDYDDTAWMSDALRAYFANYVLPNLTTVIERIDVRGDTDLEFNARVVTADLRRFEIVLNNGCLAQIYRALDVPTGKALSPLIDIASALFRGPEDYELVCRVMLNIAVIFVLFHEYSHIVAGHLDALTPADDLAAAGRALNWNEVPKPSARIGFSVTMPGVEPDQVAKVFELEADSTSYELLTEFAVDVILATEEVSRLMPAVARSDDLDADRRNSLQQLVFYACALTVSLTEWSRLDAGVQGTYPSAASRMMSLSLTLLRRQLPGEWSIDRLEHVMRITADSERVMVDFIVPTMSRALDICEACCANIGRHLDAGVADAPSQEFRRGFARDFASLAQGAIREASTAAGQELMLIQTARLAILEPMQSLRRADWWDTSQTA